MAMDPTFANQGRAKREKFLWCINHGRTVAEALVEVGWKQRGYDYHRLNHKDWAYEVDAAKLKMRRLAAAESYAETDADQSTPTTFEGFVSKWFPDRLPHRWHQLKIAEELATIGPREIKMFLLWPEAGKTATLEDYICRKLAFDPNHRFRYVSEGQDLAKRVIGTCQTRFTDRSTYGGFIDRYGPFYSKGQERKGKPWTSDQITVYRNAGTERDRNLVASSWTSQVYGSRIDTLILDDLQSQRNYNQAEEIFRRIRGTFFNRGTHMRTLIIGTRIGPGDFYERMLDANLVTDQIILPAADADGNPKVPEFWDQDEAEARGKTKMVHNNKACCKGLARECPNDGSTLTPREFMELTRFQNGDEAWWSSYMQQPRSNERSTFAEFIDRCLDHDREYGPLRTSA